MPFRAPSNPTPNAFYLYVDPMTDLLGAFPSLTTAHEDLLVPSMNSFSLASLGGAFPALETIVGDLTIDDGFSLPTLVDIGDAFPALLSVGGTLKCKATTPLTTVAGAFPLLETIGEKLELDNLITGQFGCFEALQYVGVSGPDRDDTALDGLGLTLRNFDSGSSISLEGAFPALLQVSSPRGEEGIGVYTSPGISSLKDAFPSLLGTAWFEVDTLSQLTTMEGFAPLAKAFPQTSTWVGVYSNPLLTTMSGAFAETEASGYIEVYDNLVLTDISGAFAQLQGADEYHYIEFYGNGAVDFTNAFPLLLHLNYMEIYGSGQDGASSFDGAFASLVHVDYIEIGECLALTSFVSVCPALESCAFFLPDRYPYGFIDANNNGYFQFSDNPTTADLGSSFASLEKLGVITLENNGGLTAVNAFAAATALRTLHAEENLYIVNNDSLTDITSLAAVTSIRTRLRITDNALLADISSLLNVDGSLFDGAFQGVFIQNNPSLPTAAQAQALINNLVGEGFAGTTTNTGNGPG